MSRIVSTFLILLTSSHVAWSAELRAPGPLYPTVQSAIDAAAVGDTVLVMESVNEQLFINKGLTLSGSSADVVIDGSPAWALSVDHPVRIAGASSVVLENIVIQGGGPVVEVEGDVLSMVLDGVIIRRGLSLDGGGGLRIFGNPHIDVTIEDSVFEDNYANGSGGHIQMDGGRQLSVRESQFIGGYAMDGGAIHTSYLDSIEFRSVFLCGNRSDDRGGAVVVEYVHDEVNIVNSVFVENDGGFSGGGIHLSPAAHSTIRNNHFLGNDASSGSAIMISARRSGDVEIFNNAFAFNVSGSPVYSLDAVQLHNNLWFDNDVSEQIGFSFGPGAITDQDPLLWNYTLDGNCSNDVLLPRTGSPLRDDGIRGNIGAFGGPYSNPRRWTDEDGDSFPTLWDCNDTSGQIHPDAPEICGDGIDNDCDGLGGLMTDDDGDGLTYFQEATYRSSDCSVDSDGDGISDRKEWGMSLDNPPDTDRDGVINAVDPDDDDDGILSEHEGLDDVDCDSMGNRVGDGVPNYLDDDSDGDGSPDRDEGAIDSDSDGTPNFLDCDDDGDGLLSVVELAVGTDPLVGDTDGDGLSDYEEVNPQSGVGTHPLMPDSDLDGLTDFEELRKYGTDPNHLDTDGGSIPDGEEVAQGSDPLDPTDDSLGQLQPHGCSISPLITPNFYWLGLGSLLVTLRRHRRSDH